MKSFTNGLLCAILVFLSTNLKAQNFEATIFTLTNEVVVTSFDFIESTVSNNKVIMYSNTVFEQIESIEEDGIEYYIIKPIETLSANSKDNNVNQLPVVEMFQYYIVKASIIDSKKILYTPIEWDLRIGLVVIPVKVYPFQDGPLDFSASNISQGASIGLAHQISRRKSNLWLLYSFSMNFTKVTPRPDDFDDDRFAGNDLAALSPAIGVSLSYNNADVGIFAGKDFLPGSASESWKYNGDTWYSISIGTSFNTSPSSD